MEIPSGKVNQPPVVSLGGRWVTADFKRRQTSKWAESSIAVPGTFSTKDHIFWRIGVVSCLGGKEIKRAGGKLSDLLNPVPIPQKTTFPVEVA